MQSQDITFPSNGDSAMGFFANPEKGVPLPGIVVIQEWWGLDAHIREIVRRFAELDFVALGPDLYHGVVVDEPDDARKEAMGLDRGRAMKEIDGAVKYLQSLPEVQPKKIGIVGFCMGGGIALHVATRNPDIGAVVAFYGGGAPGAEAFAGSNASILNIVGDRDRVLPSIQALDAGLQSYPHPHELIVYTDADHAFFNDVRPHAFKADAADDAWKRTINWFRKHLVEQI
jgi:carboxymethylenebutenolidase